MRRLAPIIVLAALTPAAHADRRLFTYTFEYQTQPAGETAIELYHTEARATWSSDTTQELDHRLAIEHGMTDRWDVAVSFALQQATTEPLTFHELALRNRYRFADRGEWPVDIVYYADVAKHFGESVYDVEMRGVFARDFDKVTAALNVSAAIELGNDAPENDLELGWALGATYEITPKANVGVETFGDFDPETRELRPSIGPAVAIAPASNFWFAMTAGFGLTDDAAAFAARLALGIEL